MIARTSPDGEPAYSNKRDTANSETHSAGIQQIPAWRNLSGSETISMVEKTFGKP